MAYSLRAGVVFPVDRPPIERGVVTIEGERIAAIGSQAAGGEVFELGQVALLPGLVNTHTHLEFSHLRRPLGSPGLRLVDWIRLVLSERGHGERSADESIRLGLEESIDRGVTAVGNIASPGAEPPNGQLLGEQDCPSFGRLDLTSFQEVIGFSRARAGSALAAVVERLSALGAMSRTQYALSPHAPYTVSPELLRRLVDLARERSMPVAMHVAESAEELELLANGGGPFAELLAERGMWDAASIPRDTRPLDYLRVLAEAPRALVIHGNYLDHEERAFLAANVDRISLVYCPRTHAYFGHPPYPLIELLASGVRVALGTDSRASNPDLDLLAEMRFVAAQSPEIDANEILRMGTLNGAEALGRAAELGSITQGKLANLVAIPLRDDAIGERRGVAAAIFDTDDSPSSVWLRGQRVDPVR